MDRKSVIGLLLIGVIFIGWSYFMSPSEEELAEQKRINDSIALVEEKAKAAAEKAIKEDELAAKQTAENDSVALANDSIREAELKNQYGAMYNAINGSKKYNKIETDYLIANFSNKGGRPVAVELKKFKTYDKYMGQEDAGSLYLFDEDSSFFSFDFTYQNKHYTTDELYFQLAETPKVLGDSTFVNYRAYIGEGKSHYIEMAYIFPKSDYMIDFDVNFVGLDDLMSENGNKLSLDWDIKSPSKEKGMQQERNKTTAYWKEKGGSVDYLSERSYKVEDEFETPLKWVSFKQQFFSTVLIAEDEFSPQGTVVETRSTEGSTKYVKQMVSKITVPFNNGTADMKMFLGPNKYNLIKEYDLDLEDQIDLGWAIFGWVNKLLVIPVFDLLDGLNWSYGIIIIILTIFIKLLLFPITYKTYMSSARQKVLKPEMEALNEKYKDADPMKKQQEVMKLYQQAGVNPLSGCVPALIQMPFLYAMFRFFPASIELRQQSFLWAEDLSTFDAIFTWDTQIPLLSSFYGNHMSLLTLLMSISTFFYTRYNSSMNVAQGPQAQQMKIIMYLMPLMLLGFFNNYASGLSLYYLCANIITILQQLVIKNYIIDEKAIHAKIKANMENPNKKKGRFQQRMDQVMKQQQQQNRKK